MKYEIKCEYCGAKLEVDSSMINTATLCDTCGEEFVIPLTNFAAGMVCGNYWIQRKVGTGNISEVFLAKRLSDNEKVFLKILTPAVTNDHSVIERFMIEMCRSHQIEHPNILSVFETGKMNGHYYLATNYVEGECLDKRIERTGPMSEKEALKLALKIARILRTCWHDYGIVHRAIKPSNILVDEAGEVYLLDVGNSKQMLVDGQVTLERLNNLGTLADYMSPEQAQGVVELDGSSDIYSLGATIFFLMTGTKPYTGTDTTQVLLKHLNAPTPNPLKRPGGVARDTAKLIRALMDRDPENRICSWREVVSRIKQLLKAKTHGAGTEATLKTQLQAAPDLRQPMPQQQLSEGSSSQKTLFIIIGVAVAGVLILMGLIIAIFIVATRPPDEVGKNSGKPVISVKKLDDSYLRSQISRALRRRMTTIADLDAAVEKLQTLKTKTSMESQIVEIDKAIARLAEKKADFENNMMNVFDQNPIDQSGPAKLFKDFIFIGPFKHDENKLFQALIPSEPRKFPNFLNSIRTKDKKSVRTWKRRFSRLDSGRIDLGRILPGSHENVHAYAVAEILAKSAKEVQLRMDHDDGLTVWLNGRQLYNSGNAGSKLLKMQLEQGSNVFVVRSRNYSRGWYFSVQIMENDGSKRAPADVIIRCPKH